MIVGNVRSERRERARWRSTAGRRCRALGFLLVVMASLAASAPSGARGIVALTGTSRNTALSTSFLGFNAGAGTFNADDSSFEAALSALRPETIRVFGGTGSNYINWQTGRYFVDSPVSQFSYIRTDKPQ